MTSTGSLGFNSDRVSGRDSMLDSEPTNYGGVVGESVSTGGQRVRRDLSGFGSGALLHTNKVDDLRRYCVRMIEQMKDALEIDDDPIVRNAALRDVKEYWVLLFQNRGLLQPHQREFLSHFLTCLVSPLAMLDNVALQQLIGTLEVFGKHLNGTTEKDADALITRLEEAGFDLTAPLTRVAAQPATGTQVDEETPE